MPNHCTNEVYMSFVNTEAKDNFLKKICKKTEYGNSFSFEAIIPLPNGKWDYDWCTKHWGTKWDAYDCDLEDGGSDAFVRINFLTAWSPPQPILEKILRTNLSEGLEYVRWFYRDEADLFCGYLDEDCGLRNGDIEKPRKFTGTYDA